MTILFTTIATIGLALTAIFAFGMYFTSRKFHQHPGEAWNLSFHICMSAALYSLGLMTAGLAGLLITHC